uniref:Uncharacterized protein n=1 Tax=Anguilla anguilla TaxID=7936 RepID=A0A0E9XC98_ANGAN
MTLFEWLAPSLNSRNYQF